MLLSNPYTVNGNLSRHLEPLKQHALELAREFAIAQMDDATTLASTGQDELAQRKRAKGARLLYKLTPGACSTIGGIQSREGGVEHEPAKMADILRKHWSEVFESRGVDVDLLGTWVEDDARSRRDDGSVQELMKWVKVSRKHVVQAIERSNDSSPGPDGIPYRAWWRMGADVVDVLYEALRAMVSEVGPMWMRSRYADFNASLLFSFLRSPSMSSMGPKSTHPKGRVR